ncbi:hypothetical protein VHEMI07072 [[Torrubiella] hemipterigena]|uniref:Peptidase S53 domain-containing protein n=1 Tax=[Torrubiella] hemipterigena TaxID=1531966 RepID=A0A0A1T986_9HYPO|nr:hypothetical protein VHEMI07072 [[Torrubiella] hemipterigena]
MGVTAVISSGDAGVSSRNGQCLGPHHDVFVADDFCGCPYVLCVGATKLNAIDKPEVAVDRFSSGGGFSNIHHRPSYQNHVLDNYLLRHNPNYRSYNTSDDLIPDNEGIYNRGGRAFPDISALGQEGAVVTNGMFQLSGGTSMSSPIIAAIINRINEKRLSIGKGPVDFVNPALYNMTSKKQKYQDYFNNVTSGDQSLRGIGSDRFYSSCGNKGFSCVEGWDPVTGLGTPRYDRWEEYFVKL